MLGTAPSIPVLPRPSCSSAPLVRHLFDRDSPLLVAAVVSRLLKSGSIIPATSRPSTSQFAWQHFRGFAFHYIDDVLIFHADASQPPALPDDVLTFDRDSPTRPLAIACHRG